MWQDGAAQGENEKFSERACGRQAVDPISKTKEGEDKSAAGCPPMRKMKGKAMNLQKLNRFAPAGKRAAAREKFYPVLAGKKNDGKHFAGNAEPCLAELMEDDVLHLLLASDRISVADVAEAILMSKSAQATARVAPTWKGGFFVCRSFLPSNAAVPA